MYRKGPRMEPCGTPQATGEVAERVSPMKQPWYNLSKRTQSRQRITFKLAVLVYKSLEGSVPDYLAEDCRLLGKSERSFTLPSNDSRKLEQLRTHNNYGDRAFGVAGPRVRNSLPTTITTSAISYECFRKSLKAHLLGTAYAH